MTEHKEQKYVIFEDVKKCEILSDFLCISDLDVNYVVGRIRDPDEHWFVETFSFIYLLNKDNDNFRKVLRIDPGTHMPGRMGFANWSELLDREQTKDYIWFIGHTDDEQKDMMLYILTDKKPIYTDKLNENLEKIISTESVRAIENKKIRDLHIELMEAQYA